MPGGNPGFFMNSVYVGEKGLQILFIWVPDYKSGTASDQDVLSGCPSYQVGRDLDILGFKSDISMVTN
jgi:hypothetical protein